MRHHCHPIRELDGLMYPLMLKLHAEHRVLQITTKHPIILEVNLEIHYGTSERPWHLSLLHSCGGTRLNTVHSLVVEFIELVCMLEKQIHNENCNF